MMAGLYLRLALAAGLLAAGLAGWLYVTHLRAEVARLGADLTTVEHVAETNAAAVVAIRQDSERKLAALAKERDSLAQRAARIVVIKERINRAPQSDDGPVAPVLCSALDGLWGGATGAGGACRALGSPPQPARMQATPIPAPH